jgi:hypothetical protein
LSDVIVLNFPKLRSKKMKTKICPRTVDAAGYCPIWFGATLSQTMVAQLTRAAQLNLTATISDNTLDAQLLTEAIFPMTGTVEYMFGDTVRCPAG